MGRTDTDALIPEQVSRDIIQGVTEGSAVLSMGRKLPNMTSNRMVFPRNGAYDPSKALMLSEDLA